MLHPKRVSEQLEAKREDFEVFARGQKTDLARYASILVSLGDFSVGEIADRVARSEIVGAVPSSEVAASRKFSIRFEHSWSDHAESRAWAKGILSNRTTFAVDGSQYYSEKDTSIPVGAVQIGWFENEHNEAGDYEKNSSIEILSPKELLEDLEEHLKPESRISDQMFFAELNKAGEFLSSKKGWQERGEKMPLAFIDRPMLLPFAATQSKLQRKFVDQMVTLVRASREARVPVVGYVDRSFSRDLINLAAAFSGDVDPNETTLFDTSLLGSAPKGGEAILRNWGDRTPFCFSRRKGLEAFVDPETDEPLIGLVFLKTNSDGLPARIDIPSWVFDDGLVDEVMETVRAECVVGLGYPYAIETADQTAVITRSDRGRFLKTLQEFAKKNNLNFSISRKNASKGRRR